MVDLAALTGILNRAPVVPVLIIDRLADAGPLANALVRGGLPALEVTLRTPVALEAIRARSAVAGSVVGAGTVLDGAQAKAAVEAGARFLVSPGSTPELVDAAAALSVPILPGVATASEILPGRPRRRSRLSEGTGLATPGYTLLPDRRSRSRKCARLSDASERHLRRRLVGRSQRCRQDR